MVRKLCTNVRRLDSNDIERYRGLRIEDFAYWRESGDFRVFFDGIDWDPEECRRLIKRWDQKVNLSLTAAREVVV